MFRPINTIKNTKEKKFFIEKVNLFIKLINAFAKKNNLIDSSVTSELTLDTKKRLKSLKIIESNSFEEQKKLLKTLKSQLYHELIYAVNFNLKHQQTIGDLLNKLDPSKRNAIKEKAKNKLGPRTIDFFCGAGGLSKSPIVCWCLRLKFTA